jgi:hypothetical protein
MSGIWGNCHCPAFRLLVCAANKRGCPRACQCCGQARTDTAASERSRLSGHVDARMRCPDGASQGARGVLLRRAPPACWQNGGARKGAGRFCRQAVKLFEGRLLQVSKASAPFVKTRDSSRAVSRKSTRFAKQNQYKFMVSVARVQCSSHSLIEGSIYLSECQSRDGACRPSCARSTANVCHSSLKLTYGSECDVFYAFFTCDI